MTLGASGSLSSCCWSSRSAPDRLDSPAVQARFQIVVSGEASDADDLSAGSGFIAGALGHAGEGRAHLAADAEHDDVAADAPHHLDQARCWLTQKFFDVLDAFDAVDCHVCGQCYRTKILVAMTCGYRRLGGKMIADSKG